MNHKTTITPEKGTKLAACQPHGYREDKTVTACIHIMDQHKYRHKECHY